MNIERLEHQIVILEGVAAANQAFDLTGWGGVADPNTTVGEIDSCGTACCAVGYAALDPTFQAQGLSLTTNAGGKIVAISSIEEFNRMRPFSTLPRFQRSIGLDAAEAFFGLSYAQVCWLFTPDEYLTYEEWRRDNDGARAVSPQEVIERIRHLLAGGEVLTHEDRHNQEKED